MTGDQDKIRLNKFISDTGICSRREADKLIEQGKVRFNGKVAELGTRVGPGDEVMVNGKIISKKQEELIYIALNKPVGITCTTELHVKGNIIDFVNHSERIFPIGRLDKPSQGLIFLTNDGDIVNKILRADNNHEKEYVVTVHKPVTQDFIQKMGNGIPVHGTITKKCFVKQTGKNTFTIILTQGLHRQIRLMCEYLGYEVTKLNRVRIMNVTLKDLPVGHWRNLTEQELAKIHELVADSKKSVE
jgi:23S rRNA pseudouridine2604 synthase